MPQRGRVSKARALLILTIYGCTLTLAQNPIHVPFSGKAFGLDGPWNTISVQVGSAEQSLELIPAPFAWSTVFTSDFCSPSNQNFTAANVTCYAGLAGLYNQSSSASAEYNLSNFGVPGATSGQTGFNGVSYLTKDSISFGGYNVDDAGIKTVDWAYGIYAPNERRVPLAVGTFGLGAPFDMTLREQVDSLQADSIPDYVYNNSVTRSSSFGMHIGSAAPGIQGGIPGSLWFGGYDSGRALSGMVVSTNSQSNASFTLSLDGLSMTSVNTTIAHATDMMTRYPIVVEIDATQPYMFLPASVCDAMTAPLPVHFDPVSQFYLWNTSDIKYNASLYNSKTYYTFALSQLEQSIEIHTALTLFHLNLEAPLALSNTTTPYFPCLRETDSSQYRLGQSFLQSAFIGANWFPQGLNNSTYVSWFLAQAPGPSVAATTKSPVSFLTGYIQPLDVNATITWEATWCKFWAVNTRNATVCSSNSFKLDGADWYLLIFYGFIIGIPFTMWCMIFFALCLVVLIAGVCCKGRTRRATRDSRNHRARARGRGAQNNSQSLTTNTPNATKKNRRSSRLLKNFFRRADRPILPAPRVPVVASPRGGVEDTDIYITGPIIGASVEMGEIQYEPKPESAPQQA